MDNEDRYTRITLRIPKDLHNQITEAAEASSKSANAEIVARLQDSFTSPSAGKGRLAALEIKSLVSEFSLVNGMLALVQSQPKSKERDLVLQQLSERAAGLGDVEARLKELIRQLPVSDGNQKVKVQYEADLTIPTKVVQESTSAFANQPKKRRLILDRAKKT